MGRASPSSEQVGAYRGGSGRTGDRKRSTSGSRQMSVNDDSHFLLGENEAQVMQLPKAAQLLSGRAGMRAAGRNGGDCGSQWFWGEPQD